MRTLVITAFGLAAAMFIAPLNAAEKEGIQPEVVSQIVKQAKNNENWKIASATGEEEQIVFMSVSPATNPNNEIGFEVHSFDQAILLVEGKGKAIFNGRSAIVEEGDLIFIPKGTQHNVINLNQDKAMKIISFYSRTDMPKDDVYSTSADERHS